ncbi:MAG: hypothetical protein LLG04_11800, partial [Parachlamydia sp.]|nr:hypothetical protein [Parachlamydia sp.]
MEPATSSTQTVKIPPAPADIIQNRKLGFLFAQDLFGIKKEKQKPFTEKFHDYTVRDIVSRCLFKCIKDQKP